MHLERHARRAAGKYDFECDTCLKRFITSADLKQHKRLHTAERHVCSKCGKSYSNKYSLRQHEVDHSDDKQRPHICQICGMIHLFLVDIFRKQFLVCKHVQH